MRWQFRRQKSRMLKLRNFGAQKISKEDISIFEPKFF